MYKLRTLIENRYVIDSRPIQLMFTVKNTKTVQLSCFIIGFCNINVLSVTFLEVNKCSTQIRFKDISRDHRLFINYQFTLKFHNYSYNASRLKSRLKLVRLKITFLDGALFPVTTPFRTIYRSASYSANTRVRSSSFPCFP